MIKSVKIWLAIVLLPMPLYLSMFLLGLIGLAGYWGYYIPFWSLGEPFFKYSSDTGWYYPTLYGHILAAVAYSIIFWCGYYLLKKVWRK
ncbi:hypothetical protein [Halomonas sp. AOP25-F1-15]|uniref:hypothetical protein n=1 Tax=Halomonas sp. AOP25-F1-15 TaxID=3457709 RepID=UPI0040349DA4